MRIEPDHELLQYSGRIDWEDRKAPVFIFAGSWVKIRFQGSGLSVEVTNHRSYGSNFLGYLLDGEQKKLLLVQDGEKHGYALGKGLSEREHELLLFKRMDACHYFTFHGFELEEGEILTLPEKPARRIEVFGDSVSCGEVSEAVDYAGKEDPVHDGEFSNSWYSYSWITARRLEAELHITSQGGAALLDGTGWFHGPDYIGMESIYDKIEYNPAIRPVKEWDFRSWRPNVAVIAIGQNDANPEDYMAADPDGGKAENWKARYQDWIGKLMELYPGAQFVLTTTILNHNAAWDEAIEQVCRRIDSPRVHHFLYTRNGRGTPGHIRIPEAEGMAEELSAFIRSLGDIWQEAL
ncbi:MAG: electron transporter RnfD [Roseburia sp.]|nr:electron transporter RnfD [Roseburia sp.]MCM1097357.1 electron transporter RnfD [Ruminococcus flavefaciens]